MSPEITKIIEQYLNGELSPADKLAFEKRMSENEILCKEVEFHKQIHEAAKRLSLKSNISSTAKNFHFLRKLILAGVITLTLALGTGVFYLIKNASSSDEISTEEKQTLEKILDAQAPIDVLPTHYFEWKGNDTVFVSPKGVLISVPQDAFLEKGKAYKKPILLQYQEAVDVQAIVKSGLSTMSGDKLLETQGMFGVQAFTVDKKRLDVNPKIGVYVQVPVDELKENMLLFEGKKPTNGIIDWQNPTKLQKMPTLVDMKDLNFYPPNYEDSLNKMKQRTDKKYRDSLYLSMEEFLGVSYDGMPMTYYGVEFETESQDLFESKCATCHYVHRDGTGPKLFQVRKKWSEESEIQGLIYEYMHDWKQATKKSDYVRSFVNNISPFSHNDFPKLSNYELDKVFDYIDGIAKDEPMNDTIGTEGSKQGIPPSRVIAFWKPKFNNTNLATREFEKRMQAIHRTCDPKVLALYTNNLNLSLSEIDKKVVKMGYKEFEVFSKENLAPMNEDNPHIQNLSKYYEQEVKSLRKDAKKLVSMRLKKEQQWDEETQTQRNKEVNRSQNRNAKNYSQEYEHNLESVYKQLGKKKPILQTSVGFTITTNANIYNIDRFVAEKTSSRTSGEFVDKETGKTAKLVYTPMKLKVADSKSYVRLFVYLFPNKLSSYHRIEGSNGNFEYSLNQEFQYDLCIVGYKDDGYYFYPKKFVAGTDLGTLNLEKVSEEKLNVSLEQFNNTRYIKTDDISEEIKWILREKQNYVVQKQRQEIQQFRRKIAKIVFPCQNFDVEYYPTYWSTEKEVGDIEL